jgi:hypothetical protein
MKWLKFDWYSGGDVHSVEDFNPAWIAEFRRTHAYAVWDRITDPVLFDIVEPRYLTSVSPISYFSSDPLY